MTNWWLVWGTAAILRCSNGLACSTQGRGLIRRPSERLILKETPWPRFSPIVWCPDCLLKSCSAPLRSRRLPGEGPDGRRSRESNKKCPARSPFSGAAKSTVRRFGSLSLRRGLVAQTLLERCATREPPSRRRLRRRRRGPVERLHFYTVRVQIQVRQVFTKRHRIKDTICSCLWNSECTWSSRFTINSP